MEKTLSTVLPWLMLGLNLLALSACGRDKSLARRQKRRIPERTLLLLAALGGAAGMLLGMYLFRHKTRHRKFTILVPLFLLVQICLGVLWALLSRGIL